MAFRQRKLAVFAMESVTFEKVPEWSPGKELVMDVRQHIVTVVLFERKYVDYDIHLVE